MTDGIVSYSSSSGIPVALGNIPQMVVCMNEKKTE